MDYLQLLFVAALFLKMIVSTLTLNDAGQAHKDAGSNEVAVVSFSLSINGV